MKDGRSNATRGHMNRRTRPLVAATGATVGYATARHVLRLSFPRLHGIRRSALLVIVGVWLALIVGVVAQAHGAALAGSAPSSAFATRVATNTPGITPTDTPTVTATPQVTASATPFGTPSDTPTDTPTVYVNSGTAGPQPTKLVLSQPTVGSGGGGFGGGAAGLGDSSMFIAVILGCVTSVLGIVIGGVALLALIRNGYGPFLRALLLGKRARPTPATAGKATSDRNKAGGGKGARAGVAGEPGRRVGDGTLNYQETGDLGGGLWGDSDGRQGGRTSRDPHDPRGGRDDDYLDYPADPRDSGRGRAVRQPPRSDPRSRAGASRPPSRPANRSRDGW